MSEANGGEAILGFLCLFYSSTELSFISLLKLSRKRSQSFSFITAPQASGCPPPFPSIPSNDLFSRGNTGVLDLRLHFISPDLLRHIIIVLSGFKAESSLDISVVKDHSSL